MTKMVPLSFALGAALFLFAGTISVVDGKPLNVTFLGIGVLSLALAIATWRKTGGGSGPPDT
ncbi:MAG: hypothetical protein NEA02_15215 [Thermoanaerobaculia bacterium]|nr:hypothetical protein [Thermoanaerobaculia bacterium]